MGLIYLPDRISLTAKITKIAFLEIKNNFEKPMVMWNL